MLFLEHVAELTLLYRMGRSNTLVVEDLSGEKKEGKKQPARRKQH